MTRIVIATCGQYRALSTSNSAFAKALERAGAEVIALPWNGAPRAAFLDADLVVLRQTWDYQDYPGGFAAWACVAERDGVHLANPAAIAVWNNDKRTLSEMAGSGIEIPLTLPLSEIAAFGDAPFVVKPAFGGSGSGVGVRKATQSTLDAVLSEISMEAPGRPLMAQEFITEIEGGEWSLAFIAGEFSHAVRKTPGTGEFRVNSRYGPRIEALKPPQDAIATASRLLQRHAPGLLYARIDGVMREDRFVVMEVELTDPDLFLHLAEGASERFAEATLARARQRQSGPELVIAEA